MLHYYGRRTISGKPLAIGFTATIQLLSNYFDLLFIGKKYSQFRALRLRACPVAATFDKSQWCALCCTQRQTVTVIHRPTSSVERRPPHDRRRSLVYHSERLPLSIWQHTATIDPPWRNFYRASYALSGIYATALCLCVCLSQAGIVSKRLHIVISYNTPHWTLRHVNVTHRNMHGQ